MIKCECGEIYTKDHLDVAETDNVGLWIEIRCICKKILNVRKEIAYRVYKYELVNILIDKTDQIYENTREPDYSYKEENKKR